jgi:hypothetical protein
MAYPDNPEVASSYSFQIYGIMLSVYIMTAIFSCKSQCILINIFSMEKNVRKIIAMTYLELQEQ